MEMKQKLKQELLGVKQSFVRIGYALRKIDDAKLYEQDGYKSIAEFAKSEYGLEGSTVSRFMSINREYSIDGYSERLKPEYADFNRSQLEEMLKLPEADREMVTPDTARKEIRDIKKFNQAEPQEHPEKLRKKPQRKPSGKKAEARQINRHINGLRTIVSVGGALVKSHFDKTGGSGRQIMCAEGIRKG